MSEFSDSFHLRATDPQDAIALLQRAKVPGYVFAPASGFVTFVCPRDTASHEAVIAANLGRLVHYAFSADHGCAVDVFDRDAKVASLAVDFDEARAHFERSKLIASGLLDAKNADAISRWIRGSAEVENRSANAAHVIARSLRLPHFAWLSYDYARSADDPPEDRIEVDPSGRTRSVAEAAREEIDELLATLPPTRRPAARAVGAAPAAPKKPAPKKPRPKKPAPKKPAPKKPAPKKPAPKKPRPKKPAPKKPARR